MTSKEVLIAEAEKYRHAWNALMDEMLEYGIRSRSDLRTCHPHGFAFPEVTVKRMVEAGVLERRAISAGVNPDMTAWNDFAYRLVQPHVHTFMCECGVKCEVPKVGFDVPNVDGTHRGSQ